MSSRCERALVLAILVVGCKSTSSHETADGGAPAAAAAGAVSRDGTRARARRLVAAKGGAIVVTTASDEQIRVAFPKSALKADVALRVTPLAKPLIAGGKTLVNGFVLDAEKGKSPLLSSPAIVVFRVPRPLPASASIVRYRKGGGYDVFPTQISTKDGSTLLWARVDHFSAIGVENIEPAKMRPSGTGDGTIHVITVKDTSSLAMGPTTSSVALDLQAINHTETVAGAYEGKATSKTTNDTTAGGGHASVPSIASFGNVKFDLAGASPRWVAKGQMTPSSQGTATVTAPGGGTTGSFSNVGTVPFVMTVVGEVVNVDVDVAGAQPLHFKGEIAWYPALGPAIDIAERARGDELVIQYMQGDETHYAAIDVVGSFDPDPLVF